METRRQSTSPAVSGDAGAAGDSGPERRQETPKTAERRAAAWSVSWRASSNFAEVGLWRGTAYSLSAASSSRRVSSGGREKAGCAAQASPLASLSKWGDRRRRETSGETALFSSGDQPGVAKETEPAGEVYLQKARADPRLSALRSPSSSSSFPVEERRALKFRSSESVHAKGWARDAGLPARVTRTERKEGSEEQTRDAGKSEESLQRAPRGGAPLSQASSPSEESHATAGWQISKEGGKGASAQFPRFSGSRSGGERYSGKAPMTSLQATSANVPWDKERPRVDSGETGDLGDGTAGAKWRKTGEKKLAYTGGSRSAYSWSPWKKTNQGKGAESGTGQQFPITFPSSNFAPSSTSLNAQKKTNGETGKGGRTKTPASPSPFGAAGASPSSPSSRFQPSSSSRLQSPSSSSSRLQSPSSSSSRLQSPSSSSSRLQSPSSSPSSTSFRRPWMKWAPSGETVQGGRKGGAGSGQETSSASSPASLLFSLEKREEEEARMAALRQALSAQEVTDLQREVAETVASLPAEFLKGCGHEEKVRAFEKQAAGEVNEEGRSSKQTTPEDAHAQSLGKSSSSPSPHSPSLSPLRPWPSVVAANGPVVSVLLTLAHYRLTDCERLRSMQPSGGGSSGGASVPFSPAPFSSGAPTLVLSADGKTPDALFHGHKQYVKAAQVLQEAAIPVRSLPEALVLFRLKGLAFKGAEKRLKMEPDAAAQAPRPVFASSTLQAVFEALETGTCAEIRERRQQKRLEAIASLMQIDGVGRKTAETVVDQCGILSPEELRLSLAVAIAESEAGRSGEEAGSDTAAKASRKREKKGRATKADTGETEDARQGASATLLALFGTPQLRANVLHGAALTASMHPTEFLMWQKKLVAAVGDSAFDSLSFSLPPHASHSPSSSSQFDVAADHGAHGASVDEERGGEGRGPGVLVTPVVAVGGGLFSRAASSASRPGNRPREIDVFLSMLPEPLPVPPASLLSLQGGGDGEGPKRRQPAERRRSAERGDSAGPNGAAPETVAACDWSAARREDLLEGVKKRKNELFSRFLAVLQKNNLVEDVLEQKDGPAAFPWARLIVRLPWNTVAKRQLRVRVVSPDILPFISLESRCSATPFKEIQEHVKTRFNCQLTADRLVFPPSTSPRPSTSSSASSETCSSADAAGDAGAEASVGGRSAGAEKVQEERREKLKDLVSTWVFTEDQLLQGLEVPVPLSLGQRLVSLSYRGYISASGSQRQPSR
ncbi:conserved hypothetical protein [Neospora caninum Liverpool]|uniref:Uncharacterized protein n=1 Tax=Neospora caninum (strain Liverpool) TaxID=572307 RepID=F0VD21_NEOCL|nr:conserved hypothetical protein [Neospora caninum Liverpool]CBZ51536.1 conserved hypothetical protein [Neospora caninum Liverpool]|eukprot:XP_003881569.1 conserved hypothetical protein [Neospora caninum Liverpool]